MQKNNMSITDIAGAVLIPDFISMETESDLFYIIEGSAKWLNSLGRDVMHFGYIYNYKTRTLGGATREIPKYLKYVIDEMIEKGIVSKP